MVSCAFLNSSEAHFAARSPGFFQNRVRKTTATARQTPSEMSGANQMDVPPTVNASASSAAA